MSKYEEEKLLMTEEKNENALAKDKGLCKTLKTKLWFKSDRTLLISSGKFTGCLKYMKSTSAGVTKKKKRNHKLTS